MKSEKESQKKNRWLGKKNVRIDFIVCFMSADAIFIVKCNRNRNIPREGKKRETLVHSLNFYLFIYRIKQWRIAFIEIVFRLVIRFRCFIKSIWLLIISFVSSLLSLFQMTKVQFRVNAHQFLENFVPIDILQIKTEKCHRKINISLNSFANFLSHQFLMQIVC